MSKSQKTLDAENRGANYRESDYRQRSIARIVESAARGGKRQGKKEHNDAVAKLKAQIE